MLIAQRQLRGVVQLARQQVGQDHGLIADGPDDDTVDRGAAHGIARERNQLDE